MPRIKAPSVEALLAAFFVLVFALQFALNSFTPLWGDDWWRAVAPGEAADIFSRIAEEYRTWGGRLFVLLLTFVFLLKLPGMLVLFNLINSAVFCLLLLAIFRGAVGRYPGRARADLVLLPAVWFAVWFFTQSLGEAVFWKTGAVGYLWTVTAAVFVVTPFVDLLVDEEPLSDTRWRLWGLPVVAALWATGLETVSLSLTIFMLYALLAARLRKIALQRWYWHAFAGQLAGTLLLVTAPGNWVRAARGDDGLGIGYRIILLSRSVWRHVTTEVPILYAMAALLVLLLLMRRRVALQRFYLWLMLGLMVAFAMAGSSGASFSQRTAFPAEICFIVALLALCGSLFCGPRTLTLRAQVMLLPLYAALLGVFGADIVKTMAQYLAVRQQTQRRQELMAEYKALGLRKILLPSMRIPFIDGLKDDIAEGRFFLRDLHPDAPDNGWRNGTYAAYYGFAFANRLEVPYVICASELSNGGRFTPLGRIANLSIYLRREARGWGAGDVLYCVSDRPPFIDIQELRVVPVDYGRLNFDDREQGCRKVKGQLDAVALVATDGTRMNNRFVARFELPDWKIDRIDIEHPALPRTHRATLRMDRKSISQGAAFTQVMSWKGVELHHSAEALVDGGKGSIASSAGEQMDGFLNWGPYVKLSVGTYDIEAEYATAAPGSRWEIVAQGTGGAVSLASGLLDPAGEASQVLRDRFAITPELENAPVEFRIDPADGERVELFRFSISAGPPAP
ncbi:MAG: hypothetical protein HY911_08110 [Desulfobacterales bacterium]|nr:hypothetical protein [Desulfobacterales bacterium]